MTNEGRAELNETARKAWKSIFLAVSMINERAEAAFAEAGVGTLSEFDALYTLSQCPAGLSIKELSGSMAITHSGLSRMLDRLERRGFLSRCMHQGDGRAVCVKLMPDGESHMNAQWELMSQVIATHFGSQLEDGELRMLTGLGLKLARPLVEQREARNKSKFLHKLED